MAGRIPLTDLWRLSGDSVFADEASALSGNGFRLPGADALEGFSGLLGDADAPETEEKHERPFPLPMMLPEHFPGKVSLRAELPLRQCASEHAELVFSGLYGRGTIRCGESLTRIFSGPSDLTLDVSNCLCSPSPAFVTVGFSADRPAGVDGGVSLHLWTDACITSLSCPKGSIHLSLRAEKAGRYRLLLRQLAPDDLIWFPEVELSLSAGESRGLSLPAGPAFPGRSTIVCELYREDAPKTLCDTLSAPMDAAGDCPSCYVPLSRDELSSPTETLLRSLSAAHVPAIFLSRMPQEPLTAALTHAGIPVLCPDREIAALPLGYVFGSELEPESLIANAYALCGLLLAPRIPSVPQGEAVLLREIAGRRLDEDAPGVRESLLWLRALRIRLLAEASRWGLVSGPLCAPGEWQLPDVREAIAVALRPEHVSVLPQMGAWWCGSTFRAKIRLFARPGDRAVVRLETEEGTVLAEVSAEGEASLTAKLPDAPCVLTLHTRLIRGDALLEEQTLPVYAGLRAPLEAAF